MSKKAIHVFAKWVVQAGQLDAVLTHLQMVAKKSRMEEGNLFYKLHQSSTDPNTIILFEGYGDESSAEIHKNSDYFQEIVVGKIAPLLKEREVIVTHPIE